MHKTRHVADTLMKPIWFSQYSNKYLMVLYYDGFNDNLSDRWNIQGEFIPKKLCE